MIMGLRVNLLLKISDSSFIPAGDPWAFLKLHGELCPIRCLDWTNEVLNRGSLCRAEISIQLPYNSHNLLTVFDEII